MSVAGEEIVYKLTVDGKAAKDELKAVGDSSKQLGGGLEHVKGGLEKLDSGVRESSKVLRGLGGIMGDTHNNALELLNVAGDLAGAFTSGGIFAIGMTAATFIVTELGKAWHASSDEAKVWGQMIHGLAHDDVPALIKSMNDLNLQTEILGKKGVTAAWQSATDAIKQYQQQIDYFNPTDMERTASDLKAAQDALEKWKKLGLVNIEAQKTIDSIKNRGYDRDKEFYDAAKKNLATNQEFLDQQDELLQKQAIEDLREKSKAQSIEWQKVQTAEILALHERMQTIRAQESGFAPFAVDPNAPTGIGNAIKRDAAFHAITDAMQAAQDPYEKFMKDSGGVHMNQEKSYEEQHVKFWIEMANKRGDIEQQAADSRQRLRELEFEHEREKIQQALDLRKQYASESLSIGVNASQQLVDSLITGQKDALAHFASSVFKQAGTAMIGHGIDAAAGGIAMLSLGNPAGGIPLATGGALIAGGLTIGGIGTGIEHVLAGGTIGKGLPDKAGSTADAGARGRSGGSLGSGGNGSGRGFTVNNYYGVGGPQADDNARRMRDLLNLARRRGFT